MLAKARDTLHRFKVTVPDSTRLINKDIEPLAPDRRTWHYVTYTGFWSIANINVSAWMSASVLLDLGLSIGQVFAIIVVGNALVSAMVLVNSYQGTKWHVGYTIVQRVVFGIYGSYLAVALRFLLSVVWFGAQAWFGGLAVTTIISSWSHNFLTLKNTIPENVFMTTRELIGFVIYYVIQWPLFWIPPQNIDKPTVVANIVTFCAMLAVCIWASRKTHIRFDNDTVRNDALGRVWIYGLTSWYGSLSTGIVNQSDFARFSKTRWSAVPGTILAYAIPGTLVPFFGVLTAFSTHNLYGEYIWNPIDLADKWLLEDYSSGTRAASFFVALSMLLSQLCLNTLANGLAGGIDLSGMFPRYITIRRGALITSLVSWVCQPWRFFNTGSVFLEVMSSFAVFLSPLIGLMVCDFYVIRRRRIMLSQCYSDDKDGTYFYTWGVNFRAVIAWVVGWAVALPGMIANINGTFTLPVGLMDYYSAQALIGMGVSFVLYFILCWIWPVKNAGVQDKIDHYGAFTPEEAERIGLVPQPTRPPSLDEKTAMEADDSEKAIVNPVEIT